MTTNNQSAPFANLSDSDAELLFTAAVKVHEPGVTAIDEVDHDTGRVIYSVGSKKFARQFEGERQRGGNTELTISHERQEVQAVTTLQGASDDPIRNPPDPYRIALAKRNGTAPAEPFDPLDGYATALAARRAQR
jgi:hypothetical protein